jgi:hypothetical protein
LINTLEMAKKPTANGYVKLLPQITQ